jgi:hypothetical protein
METPYKIKESENIMEYVVGNINTFSRLVGIFSLERAKQLAKEEDLSVYSVDEWNTATIMKPLKRI